MYIPNRFEKAKFLDIEEDIQKEVRKQLSESKKGVALYGDAGVGKSWNLYAIAEYLEKTFGAGYSNKTEKNPEGDYSSGFKIDFFDFGELVNRLKNFNSEFDGQELLDRLTNVKEASRTILFLDDLAVSAKNPDFAVENLRMILNVRYNENLPVFISTNYSLEEMAEKLGKRNFSRIQGLCKMLPMVGEDRRKKEIE